MATQISWQEAIKSYLTRDRAIHAHKTMVFHRTHLTALTAWAEAQDLAIHNFGKRHLDEYIAYRKGKGLSPKTLFHDAVNAKTFLKWCVHYDILERNPLADYRIRNPPRTEKSVPTPTDMARLLEVAVEFWDPQKNPHVRNSPPAKRSFHRDRNFAILTMLLCTACRINEVLSLKVGNYKAWSEGGDNKADIFLEETKGREEATLPITTLCQQAVGDWLKVRARVMKQVPAAEDQSWLFISESGNMIDNSSFLKVLKRYLDFGGIPRMRLHDIRGYSITELAQVNLLAAQRLARHKDTKTTLGYTGNNADFLRRQQQDLDVVGSLLKRKRPAPRKRLQF